MPRACPAREPARAQQGRRLAASTAADCASRKRVLKRRQDPVFAPRAVLRKRRKRRQPRARPQRMQYAALPSRATQR